MTVGERSHFKEVGDTLSFFRKAPCEKCGTDIPKNKRFCSKKCHDEVENGEEDE
jgi:hypothetical protein